MIQIHMSTFTVQMTQAAQGPLHPAVAAALKPLVQLFWRQGDASTAVALQQHACAVLDSEASHAISGEAAAARYAESKL